MARARKHIAGRRHQDGTAAPVPDVACGSLPSSHIRPMLALRDLPDVHREQILALVRVLARDAARADHAAEDSGDDHPSAPCRDLRAQRP